MTGWTPQTTQRLNRATSPHRRPGDEDPHRRRVRGRQDDPRGARQRDPSRCAPRRPSPRPSAGVDDLAGLGEKTTTTVVPWTSGGSPSAPAWPCTCSALPASGASGTCGRGWPSGRSAARRRRHPPPGGQLRRPGPTRPARAAVRRRRQPLPGLASAHDDADLRDALDLLPETPLVHLDARTTTRSTQALIALVQYAARLKLRRRSRDHASSPRTCTRPERSALLTAITPVQRTRTAPLRANSASQYGRPVAPGRTRTRASTRGW